MKIIFSFLAGMIALLYETIMEILGCCPIPVVCGVNQLGKTKLVKAVLTLIGKMASFYSTVKERLIPWLCSRTTLSPVLDDIKKPKLIEDNAAAFYNRGKDGRCFLESMPRTCPIVTVNWETLHALNHTGDMFLQLTSNIKNEVFGVSSLTSDVVVPSISKIILKHLDLNSREYFAGSLI